MNGLLERVDVAVDRWREIESSHALRAVEPDRIRAEVASARNGMLSGLLFSVKDVLPVAGVESCAGSLVLEGNIPRIESPLIAAIRESGAVVFGKGVCAEFGFGVDTENRLDGRVTNPLDDTVSPGGSSGGDAVAVANGVVDFAIGGDYGGSVRWPAQATGVLGLRMGLGRSPARNQLGAPSTGLALRLDAPGILARSPRLLGSVVSVITGDASPDSPSGRLLTLRSDALGAVSDQVSVSLERAEQRARLSGYTVVEASPMVEQTLIRSLEVYRALRSLTDGHDGVRAIVAGREALLCDSTRAVLAAAAESVAAADGDTVLALEREATLLAEIMATALGGFDGLLMPLAASGPLCFGGSTVVGGTVRDAVSLHDHLRAVSLTGLPALSVPVGGRSSVQIVGRARGELTLCALAEQLDLGVQE